MSPGMSVNSSDLKGNDVNDGNGSDKSMERPITVTSSGNTSKECSQISISVVSLEEMFVSFICLLYSLLN